MKKVALRKYVLSASTGSILFLSIIAYGSMIAPVYGGINLEVHPDLKCYGIKIGNVQPEDDVEVEDQFGSETVELGVERTFCVPVLKNPSGEETPPEFPHFIEYEFIGTIDPPPVKVTDQFGTAVEDPIPAEALYVGALKNPEPEQSPPALHYIAYDIGSSLIDPPSSFLLRDQFTDETGTLEEGNILLVPALKNGEGTEEIPHYRCYDFDPLTERFEPGLVTVKDQFGERDVELGGGFRFCAVAEKLPIVVGGEIIPIESTALMLAGAQTFSWMIPVVLSVLGIGLFVVTRKSENS